MVKLEGIYRGRTVLGYEVLMEDGAIPLLSNNGTKERLFDTLSPDLDLTLFLHHVNWAKEHLSPDHLVFINLKPQTLIEYADEIVSSIHSRVVIELREDWMSDSELQTLIQIRKDFMFLLSLDDFGRRASNIERVKALLPNFIKVDVSLLPDPPTLFKLVDLLDSLHSCHIIAEKVETEREFKMVRAAGVHLWQGWYERVLEQACQETA